MNEVKRIKRDCIKICLISFLLFFCLIKIVNAKKDDLPLPPEEKKNYLNVYKGERENTADGYESLQFTNYITYENDTSNDYMFFCNKLGTPPILTVSGGIGEPDITEVISKQHTDKMNLQIAYAMSIGVLPKNQEGSEESWEDLQWTIWDANASKKSGESILSWDSKVNKNIPENVPIEVQRFKKVYEEIIKETIEKEKPLFKIENKDSSLFIDQNDGTYIYGPFQLKINSNASQDAIEYLRNEILEQGTGKYIEYEKGEGYIENFYKFHESIEENFTKNQISDSRKKKLRYDISGSEDKNLYSTIIVDNVGKPIDFPKINQTDNQESNFFIKFYPYNEGSVIELGNKTKEIELFSLKVKYGGYITYYKHVQTGYLETKGITYYSANSGQNYDVLNKEKKKEINPNEFLLYTKRITESGYEIENDIVNNGRSIKWPIKLKEISRPYRVGVYQDGTCVEKRVLDFTDANIDNERFNKYYGGTIRLSGLGIASLKVENLETTSLAGEKIDRFNGSLFTYFPLSAVRTFSECYGNVLYRNQYVEREEIYKKDENNDEYILDENGNKILEDIVYTTHVEYIKEKIETTDEEIKNLVWLNSFCEVDYEPPSSYSMEGDYGKSKKAVYIVKDDELEIYYNFTNWIYTPKYEGYQAKITLASEIDSGYDLEYKYKEGRESGAYCIVIPAAITKQPEWGKPIPYDDEDFSTAEEVDLQEKIAESLQTFVSFEDEKFFEFGTTVGTTTAALPYSKVAEAFGGNVWKESGSVKENLIDGKYSKATEEPYQGVKVDLYECKINYKEPYSGQFITDKDIQDGVYLTSTFTDENGDYRFYGKRSENEPLINPLRKYYVKFVYNGQIYAQTLYNVESNSEYGSYADVTSKGIDEYRDKFNKRFENIYADSNNYTYTGQRYTGCNNALKQNYTYTGRAYGLKHVIKEAIDNPNYDSNLDTFEEQYSLFIKNNTHEKVLTTTAEYEFQNASPGNQLNNPVIYGTGEIVQSDIDKQWEHPVGQPIDFNYSGLAPSVVNYLKDCMIEASVPYTPDLTVYGKNLDMTTFKAKTFPEEATFTLKDMTTTYTGKYEIWKLSYIGYALKTEKYKSDIYIIPPEVKAYIGDEIYPPGTEIITFEENGEKYVYISRPETGERKIIKVASLNAGGEIGIEDSVIKVAGDLEELVPRNEPPEGGETPGDPGGSGSETWHRFKEFPPDIKVHEGVGIGSGEGEPLIIEEEGSTEWKEDPTEGEEWHKDPDPEYILVYMWIKTGGAERKVKEYIYTPYTDEKQTFINLYNKEFDLRHCWNFGVYQRDSSEINLQKDLYKATMVVNGKKEVYSYSKKLKNQDGGKYNIIERDSELVHLSKPLNGGEPYTREVRKSDYLYDTNVAYGDGTYSKNIKAYLTYKLVIRNSSPYTIRVNEIADYYDADNLEFDGIRDASGRYEIRTHTQNVDGEITKSKYTYATNISDVAGHDINKEYMAVYDYSAYANGGNQKERFSIANTDTDNDGNPYNLQTIYIRGNGAEGIPVVTMQDGKEVVTNELIPGQCTVLFVTFKVKNNAIDKGIKTFANQIKLDQISRDFAQEIPTIGKNNFAEINSYSTYYTHQMPDDAPVDPADKLYYRPYGEGRIVYGKNQAKYLDLNGKEVGVETNPDILIAGMVDVYSDPGSFTDKDVEVVYTDGGAYKELQFKDSPRRKITRTNYPKISRQYSDEEELPLVEPDMDKAPTIRIILDQHLDVVRNISGYVFEDNRNVNKDGSPIGDGKNNGETKVNGVTVQLVELIQEVDSDGTFTGKYIGEKVWDECEYTGESEASDKSYQLKVNSENQGAQYYSGKGKVKYILNAVNELGLLHTNPDSNGLREELERQIGEEIRENDGKYCFVGIPSGDFVVRFLYGDTDRTVLTNNADNEVNKILGDTRKGMNAKSYNGQDYKSTVYQRDLATGREINQSGINYVLSTGNVIKGYVNPEKQDYATTKDYKNNKLRDKESLYDSKVILDYNSADYDSMWRYDRLSTENYKDLSDANDLYGYRQRGIDYAQGYPVANSDEGKKTLLNYRSEVLNSFEKLTSQEAFGESGYVADVEKQKITQSEMIEEFTANTYMVAQTGIISMNNEYEGINTGDPIDNSTGLHQVEGDRGYINHETNVDLGLVERPRAQIKLTKKVSNVEIRLADDQLLFNTNTQMQNLMFKEHTEHEITYDRPQQGPILEKVRVALEAQTKPELIKAEIDDEIMNGATINVTYHLQVENVGEIDYMDKGFYFYGNKTNQNVEPVTTTVERVIDYVANDISYDSSKQNADASWDVYEAKEVIPSGFDKDSNNNKLNTAIGSYKDPVEYKRADGKYVYVKNINDANRDERKGPTYEGVFYDQLNRDYVTRTYSKEVSTYNTIVVTKDLNDALLPTLYVNNKDELAGQNIDKTTLILTTSVTASGNSEDLTYNNLAEVIEVSNPYGRRMQFSIVGNQEMANQDINDGGAGTEEQDHHGYSASKIVQPKEIDADSAQQVQMLPPTGSVEQKNRVLVVITTAIATIIVLVGAIIIKKKVYGKEA